MGISPVFYTFTQKNMDTPKKITSIRWELHKLYNEGYTLDQMEGYVHQRLEDGLIDIDEVIKALVGSRFCELVKAGKIEKLRKFLDHEWL